MSHTLRHIKHGFDFWVIEKTTKSKNNNKSKRPNRFENASNWHFCRFSCDQRFDQSTHSNTHTFNVSCICTHLFYVVGNQDRIWRVLLVPVAVVFYTDAMMVQHQMLSIHPMNSLQHPYTKYIGKIRWNGAIRWNDAIRWNGANDSFKNSELHRNDQLTNFDMVTMLMQDHWLLHSAFCL